MQDIDKELEFFDQFSEGLHGTFTNEMFGLIFGELDKLNLKGNALEAGCGTALFGKAIIDRYPNISITGVDLNQKFVDIIEKTKNPRYKAIVGNLENQQLFAKDSFDIIFFPYVLHHFPDISMVMANSHYWLRNNGCVFIIDPNGSNLILKIGYRVRKLLAALFPKEFSKVASFNEKNISLNTFMENFKDRFTVIILKDFLKFELEGFSKDTKSTNFNVLIRYILNLKMLLLKAYYHLPLQYSGTDLIIVSKKE